MQIYKKIFRIIKLFNIISITQYFLSLFKLKFQQNLNIFVIHTVSNYKIKCWLIFKIIKNI